MKGTVILALSIICFLLSLFVFELICCTNEQEELLNAYRDGCKDTIYLYNNKVFEPKE